MESIKEVGFEGYPKLISYDCCQKIMVQMKKHICKINITEEDIGTGFFCKIPFPDKNKMLPVFITNNHVINEKILYKENARISIKIKEDNMDKEINLNNRKKYTNKEYDITIIEIKENDEIKDYLELDEKIINHIINNKNENNEYMKETIYIIQYPEGELSVSYGIIQNICSDKHYNLTHKCSTRRGSSGSPILNLKNKIIGIHKEANHKNNIGTFINYPIKDFIQKFYYNKKKGLKRGFISKKNDVRKKRDMGLKSHRNSLDPFFGEGSKQEFRGKSPIFHNKNKILISKPTHPNFNIIIKPTKNIINNIRPNKFENIKIKKIGNFHKPKSESLTEQKNQISIIYNIDGVEKINLFGDYFVNNNISNCYLIIDDEIIKLKKHLILDQNQKKIQTIEIKLIESYPIIDMSYMFYDCSSLKCFEFISNWFAQNVINMSFMFYNCKSLEYIPYGFRFDTKKVTDLSCIFYNCNLLKSLPVITRWDKRMLLI